MDLYRQDYRGDQRLALSSLYAWLKETFNLEISLDPDSEESRPDRVLEAITAAFEADLASKTEYAGEENLNHFIRFQYLQAIDQKWLDHLENLEALREAVYLRHYGQKNPLLEYKLEGFEIFDLLIEDIKRQIATRVFLVRIKRAEERTETIQRPSVQGGTARSRVQAGQMDEARPSQAQVTRSYPKVGRNEPCPCGSGKKYKFCHGA